MSIKNKKIWVTFQKEGIHCFPRAASDPQLSDVSYLQYPHRHLFYFKVTISVFHDDREIEFIQFNHWLQSLYSTQTLALDYKSCEMIADDLLCEIYNKYPNRSITVDVSEDNENGAQVDYQP